MKEEKQNYSHKKEEKRHFAVLQSLGDDKDAIICACIDSGLFTIIELTEMINNIPYKIGFSSEEDMQRFIRYISGAGGHITEDE